MNKVWSIAGAGSGIGTGTAKAALQAGDRVVAIGRNLDKVRNAFRDVHVGCRGSATGDESQGRAVEINGWFVLAIA